jgi:hypothetical protein
MAKNYSLRQYKISLAIIANKIGLLAAIFINLILCSSCKKETITSSQPAEKIEISVSRERAFLHLVNINITLADGEKVLEFGAIFKANFSSNDLNDSAINKTIRYFPESTGKNLSLQESVILCSGKKYQYYAYVITENGKSISEVKSIDVVNFFNKNPNSMPFSLAHGGSFVFNNTAYFLGGSESDRNLFSFNGSSWSQLSNYYQLPSWLPIEKFCTFVLDGNVFYTTGYQYPNDLGTDSIFRYNPSAVSPQPVLARFGTGIPARYSAISFVINDKAYIGLGLSGAYKLNDFYSYKLGDGFVPAGNFEGSGGSGSGVFVLDNKAYIFGGENERQFWEFDPNNAGKPWTRKNDLPFKYKNGASGSYNGYGIAGFGELESDLFVYDAKKDSWSIIGDEDESIRVYAGASVNFQNSFLYCGGRTPSISPVKDYYILTE